VRDGELQCLLDDARRKHNVVGASLALLKGGTIEATASGVVNLDTQIPCTPDTVFQIGSISKVFTATLIMQSVEEGRLKLDAPVIEYVPDFMLADPVAAQTVSTRQLLNHTCGIDGDFFPADNTDGPSASSYIHKMCLLPNLYSPGQGPMTYSNAGYVVAGRLVEILTGRGWPQAVMERVCRPLGMRTAFADPKASLRFRCAMGHVQDPEVPAGRVLSSQTFLPLSMAAAGTVLSMSAESLLTFAHAHTEDVSANSIRIVSKESVRRMRDDVVEVIPFSRSGVTHWGLGWFIGRDPKYCMVGHDGGTAGQFAYLRTFPEHNIAFTLLTNSPSDKMFREVELHLMHKLLGVSIASNPPPECFEPRFNRYIGHYHNVAAHFRVTLDGAALRLQFVSTIGAVRQFQASLAPYRPDTFEIQSSDTVFDGQKISFIGENEDGEALFLRFGLRMGRRGSHV
jgi:CubicO group peptidase (beta-lactamase class C family)